MMLPEGRWLPGSLTPEYRADDPAPAKQPPMWSLGIDREQAVILCSCGQWWQGDPEDIYVGGDGPCRRSQPGHRVLAVITTWEEWGEQPSAG